jgi:hypothetical protein
MIPASASLSTVARTLGDKAHFHEPALRHPPVIPSRREESPGEAARA